MTNSIMIVDDEASVRTSLEKVLSRAGYVTRSAESGSDALRQLARRPADLVLSDLKMPDVDGLELLRKVRKKYPKMEVVLLTGYGTVEKAVEAMKDGAYDFITKPFKRAVLLKIVERALERRNLTQENEYLRAQLGKGKPYDTIIGKSQALQDVLAMVERVAPLVSTVLITGGSGTGKELIARALHRKSNRIDKRFVPINCAAIPENLIESELFGHMRGSFTGAIRDKEGLFKVADGGTLFLDEIVSVPLNLQAKLLRAIEQKEILPVGSTDPQVINVRIIAATNRNLASEVEKGNFREDLYYRLNVVGITIPPLKERAEDVPELLEHYIRVYNAQLNKKVQGVDGRALQILMDYEWKGNVRELENAVERAMILCDDEKLALRHFPHLISQDRHSQDLEGDLKSAVRKFEQERIIRAIEISDQDKAKAAQMLGLSLSSLYRKLAELGINLKE